MSYRNFREEVEDMPHAGYSTDGYVWRIEAAEIAARADARITEIERECSQWRDELRIYRETENKRIAELEQALTVRDTEIARLETDSELARRDAERYRWLRDSDNEGPISAGNATAFGEYGFERVEWFYGDELDAAVDEARAGNGGWV